MLNFQGAINHLNPLAYTEKDIDGGHGGTARVYFFTMQEVIMLYPPVVGVGEDVCEKVHEEWVNNCKQLLPHCFKVEWSFRNPATTDDNEDPVPARTVRWELHRMPHGHPDHQDGWFVEQHDVPHRL